MNPTLETHQPNPKWLYLLLLGLVVAFTAYYRLEHLVWVRVLVILATMVVALIAILLYNEKKTTNNG